MANALRHFQRDASVCSVEELQAHIDGLTMERQRLRAESAADGALETNRLQIARAQWELSHALIQRYLPAA